MHGFKVGAKSGSRRYDLKNSVLWKILKIGNKKFKNMFRTKKFITPLHFFKKFIKL